MVRRSTSRASVAGSFPGPVCGSLWARRASRSAITSATPPCQHCLIQLTYCCQRSHTFADTAVAVTYKYVNGCTKSAIGVRYENHLWCWVQIQTLPSPKRAPRLAAWKFRRYASAATILPKAWQSCIVATQVRLFSCRFGGQAGSADAGSVSAAGVGEDTAVVALSKANSSN